MLIFLRDAAPLKPTVIIYYQGRTILVLSINFYDPKKSLRNSMILRENTGSKDILWISTLVIFAIKLLLIWFNPRLPQPFFVTRLPKGGLPTSPYIFAVKPPILMILILGDRYESPLSIDTKKEPVALHLMSQWSFYDDRVTKKQDFADFGWK